jgi:dCMP deaminase
VQGYNGAPAGLLHCNHDCDCGWEPHMAAKGAGHQTWCKAVTPCLRAVHAEQNAISFAARWGVGLEGAELFCTNQPCLACAQTIINAGIVKVIYAEPYRLRDGHELLEEAGIEVGQFVDFVQPS